MEEKSGGFTTTPTPADGGLRTLNLLWWQRNGYTVLVFKGALVLDPRCVRYAPLPCGGAAVYDADGKVRIIRVLTRARVNAARCLYDREADAVSIQLGDGQWYADGVTSLPNAEHTIVLDVTPAGICAIEIIGARRMLPARFLSNERSTL
jgi:uncharacterized protein YuzE